MSKHTPSPWVLVHTGRVASHRHVMTEGGRAIANICDSGVLDSEECEANASLIAAAPKLLEALLAFRDVSTKMGGSEFRGWHSSYSEAVELAIAAIAEAEGG